MNDELNRDLSNNNTQDKNLSSDQTQLNDDKLSPELEEKAQKVIQIVEMILDNNSKIRDVVKIQKRRLLIEDDNDADELDDPKTAFVKLGKKIVNYYSNKASVSGGVSSLPALLPGVGSLIGILGGSAADIAFMLKYEIEMTLCLCDAIGLDIDDEYIRKLAFTLAIVSSFDIMSHNSKTPDSVKIVASAFWDYSARKLSKHLITVLASILWLNASRGLVKAVPVVGVIVGASFNKLMTKRTGLSCIDALWIRRPELNNNPDQNNDYDDEVYDAELLD